MKYTFRRVIPQLKVEEQSPLFNNRVRFIVDAQLPKKLSDFFITQGFDSIHTLDLPDKNATTDKYIITLAENENRILITKDDDFLRSFMISKKPEKLVLVKTGNIRNTDLIELFETGLSSIVSLLRECSLIEITQNEIIVHS